MNNSGSIGIKHILILVLLSIIWGTSFILVKRGLLAFSPVQLASLRIVIAGLGFLPAFIYYVQKERIRDVWKYILVGMTGTAIPAFFFALAQTEISSSIAGIMNSLTPIFTIIIGLLFYSMSVRKSQSIGVAIGLIGAVILIILGQEKGATNNMWYAGFVAVCSILYALNLNFVKKHFQNESSIRLSAISFVIVAIPTLIYILFSDIPNILLTPQGLSALWYVIALAIMSTMIALIIFYKLVQETNPIFAASVSYIVPIVALMWGYIDGEFIGLGHLLSLVMIIFGVYLIRKD